MTLPIVAALALSARSATPSDSGSTDQAPRTVKEGETFTIGTYTVSEGWKLANDGVGGFAAEDVTVKNTSDETDSAYFRLKVFDDSKVIAEIDCNTSEIEAGQSRTPTALIQAWATYGLLDAHTRPAGTGSPSSRLTDTSS